jgi:predicted MFS family arabinose efflux permease
LVACASCWKAGGVVVAHQGGWDEIILVAAPIALFAVLLWFANNRAKRQLEADDADTSDHAPPAHE